jgi:hypothetical protein
MIVRRRSFLRKEIAARTLTDFLYTTVEFPTVE